MPSAAILAGGQARRFGGRDKSALLVDGRTILDRQIEVLEKVADDLLVVGGAPDHRTRPARAIADRRPGCGPLGGLDAALAAARGEAVLVIACDMPFIRPEFLTYLLSHARRADAVVPRTAGGDHPLCAVYSRSCAALVDAQLNAGDFAMRTLLRQLRVHTVFERDIEAFGRPDTLLANVNTPGELADLAAVGGHES